MTSFYVGLRRMMHDDAQFLAISQNVKHSRYAHAICVVLFNHEPFVVWC